VRICSCVREQCVSAVCAACAAGLVRTRPPHNNTPA
jgi:hypothetical protein